MSTQERLSQIRERCERATSGPWKRELVYFEASGISRENIKDDAEFIARAREDVPFLLDLCDKQARALEIAKNCLIMCRMVLRGHGNGLDESCERNLTAIDEALK